MYVSLPENPLRDVLSDELFTQLWALGVLDVKGVRDYAIRAQYKAFRAQHIGSSEAIERIQASFPYLQFDTIRKIVYSVPAVYDALPH